MTTSATLKRKRGGTWRTLFLDTLRQQGNVAAACRVAGVNRKTAYAHRERYPMFAQEWDEAIEQACDLLEEVVWGRAKCGPEDRSSATLAIFLLKAHRPKVYGHAVTTEVTGKTLRIIVGDDGDGAA